MAEPGSLARCAEVATRIAQPPRSAEWQVLSELMCWDAVAHCALLAGVLDDVGHAALRRRQRRDVHLLVGGTDALVADAAAVAQVPAGHVIGFFDREGGQPVMIHVMVSTGGGLAAGNKNGCLKKAGGGDIGRPIGWEVVDLRELAWAPGRPCLRQDTQDIEVRHRPLTALAAAL